MYTIKMDDDKSLITTVYSKLLQRENLINKIQFLIPAKYENIDLTDFTVVLKYITPSNVAKSLILVKDKDLYKGYLRFVLPVDSDLSMVAGDIKIRLTLTKVDLESNTQYVAHSEETYITILPVSDYFAFIPNESLEAIDQIVGLIDAKLQAANNIAEAYHERKADNILLENGNLSLSANGHKIGDSISVSTFEGTEASTLKTIYF
ncbi:MAG: hypothetical protein LUH21_17670 [Clostridiales bacterium]|nr:hypothetical protein [Clostridiales bacterium]